MLVAEIKDTREEVIAWEVEKKDGPFICPECSESVYVKKGEIVTHHFAHFKDEGCPMSQGETESHMRIKKEIYTNLLRHPTVVSELRLEYKTGRNRADIYGIINGRKIAIEVQCSSLTDAEFQERMTNYSGLSIFSLWLTEFKLSDKDFLLKSIVKKDSYHVREFIKRLHRYYDGRIYAHYKREWVMPLHFTFINKRESHPIMFPRGFISIIYDFETKVSVCDKSYLIWADKLHSWWKY